jgi:hypothetical protein
MSRVLLDFAFLGMAALGVQCQENEVGCFSVVWPLLALLWETEKSRVCFFCAGFLGWGCKVVYGSSIGF